jgi:hypothetical protein
MAMNEVMMTYSGEILQAKTCLKNLFREKLKEVER